MAVESHAHPLKGRDGENLDSIAQEASQTEYTVIAMEYGTVPVLGVLNTLRAEHWLNNRPVAPPEQAQQIKAQMLAAFYTDTRPRRVQIISQACQAMFQTVNGLQAVTRVKKTGCF